MKKSKLIIASTVLALSMLFSHGSSTAFANTINCTDSVDVEGILGGSGSDESSNGSYNNGGSLESSGGQNAKDAGEAFKNMGEAQVDDRNIDEADRITKPAQNIIGYILSVMGIIYFLAQAVITVIDLFTLLVPAIRPKLLGVEGGRQFCSDTAYGVLAEAGLVNNDSSQQPRMVNSVGSDKSTIATNQTSRARSDSVNSQYGNQVQQCTTKKVSYLSYLLRRGVFIVSATIVIFLVLNNVFMKVGFFLGEKVGEIIGF